MKEQLAQTECGSEVAQVPSAADSAAMRSTRAEGSGVATARRFDQPRAGVAVAEGMGDEECPWCDWRERHRTTVHSAQQREALRTEGGCSAVGLAE